MRSSSLRIARLEPSAERVNVQFFRNAGRKADIRRDRAAEVRRAVQYAAVRHDATRIDRLTSVRGAKATNCVIVFQG